MKRFENWRTVATRLPEARLGNWRVVRRTGSFVRPYWFGDTEALVIGDLTYLYEGETEWMADDPARVEVMRRYANQAWDSVLVGGLGLGLLVEELRKNPRVKNVLIVEESTHVIDMVWPEVKGRAALTEDDFWETASRRGDWDVIIADLWDDHAQHDLLMEEVRARARKVRDAHPHARVILHGFPELSDYDPLRE